MDLTSLSSNLPRNAPTDQTAEDQAIEEPPSSMILSSFKSAALSVTTLYRTAAEQVDRSRRIGRIEGYNDCIDDILNLLSRVENRTDPTTNEVVRQWALSRRRKAGTWHYAPRDDRETSVESDTCVNSNMLHQEQQVRSEQSDQPEQAQESQQDEQQQQQQGQQQNQSDYPQPLQCQSAVSTTFVAPLKYPIAPPQLPVFSFRSEHNLPQGDIAPYNEISSPPDSPNLSVAQTLFSNVSGSKNVVNQPRSNPHSRGHQPRTGNKRRIGNINDFFELAGLEKLSKKGRFQ